MKNTLIVNREYISDPVIEILKMPSGITDIETIDNGHSYIINFNPNKTEINKYRENIKELMLAKSVEVDNIDKIIEGVILSNLAAFYGKVYSALMSEIINQYVKHNLGKTFSISEITNVITKL